MLEIDQEELDRFADMMARAERQFVKGLARWPCPSAR
ncbi:hypothetical protein SUDANB121_00037 [Nocardiopsis dassonvillei]